MKYCILALLLLSLYSCGEEEKLVREFNIDSEEINYIQALNANPYSMFYEDETNTILLNMTRGKYPIMRINLDNGETTGLLGIGKGHNEYIQLRVTDNDPQGNIYAMDYPMILNFSRDGTLLSQQKMSDDHLNLFWINRFKDLYVGYGNFAMPKSLLTIYDNEWNEIGSFGEFPDDGVSENEGGKFGKIMAYQGIILSSDNRSKIAYVSRSGEFFTIFETEETYHPISTYRKCDNLPKYKNNRGKGIGVIHISRDFFYVGAYNTDNKLYILYSGKEIIENSNKGFTEASYANKILVYDWNGNHLYNLKTNLNLINICVSKDDREIIAVYHDDNYQIRFCRFDVSDTLCEVD